MMMNICFINSTKFWGGGEKLHFENAVEFKKLGYNVYLAAEYASPLWEKAVNNHIKAHRITVENLSFLNPLKIVGFAKFLRKNKIDTVFFSSSQDAKFGSLAAYLANVERVVYLRGLATPIKNSFINRLIFKRILTHIIPNSNETKKAIFKHLKEHIGNRKVKTIYHGIYEKKSKNEGSQKIEAIKEKGRGVILGNAARLSEQKGQKKLIEVAKQLRDDNVNFTLFIAGTGDLQSELEMLIMEYQLEKYVFLLGFVDNMSLFMNSIDIFLFPAFKEGFGYALVEAMVHCKPTVAFDVTSPEVIEDGVTGLLATYPNIEMLTVKTALLIKNESLRHKLGKAGSEKAKGKFMLKDKVLEIEAFLNENSNSRKHNSEYPNA